MIKSCNHSSTEKLCGSCREKNYRQSFLDEKDARIAELERQLAELREAVAWLSEVSDGYGANSWAFWLGSDASDELSYSHGAAWAEVERLLESSHD